MLWPGSAHAVAGDREVSEGLPVVREITGYGMAPTAQRR